jgi:Holliday junction DNA helicase RuvA
MIASIRGILRATAANHLVIETGGIGFQVYAPRPVLERAGAIGEEISLLTVLIVREDALTLYGFADAVQRNMFETLIGVSGVGPRIALALLSSATPDEIRLAVAHNDGARLARVPGIGKKMAERLLLELKSKLDLKKLPAAAGAESAAPAPAAPGVASVNSELADLLVSLGYSSSEAQAAIAALPADAPTELEERLRLALRYFGSA